MGPRDLLRSSHSEHEEFRERFKKRGTLDEISGSNNTSDMVWQMERSAIESHSREGPESSQDHSQSRERLWEEKFTHRWEVTHDVCIVCYRFLY